MDKTPAYKYPASYARENDELELYRASSKANVACKEAIEQAIAAHYFDNILHHGAVKEVVDQFGYERTLYVLANTVRQKDWDGRISYDNKAWAQTIPVFENPDAWGQSGLDARGHHAAGRPGPRLAGRAGAEAQLGAAGCRRGRSLRSWVVFGGG